jgi:tetratricopeptide (TPR) repeat protein
MLVHRRVLVAALGLGLVAVGAVGVGARVGGPSSAAAVETAPAGRLPTTTEELQAHLRARPGDWRAWNALGFAYVDQARLTGNPELYPKAEGSFERSLRLRPEGNDGARAGQGALANARHDFAEGLRRAEQAGRSSPRDPSVLAVRSDALTELGRYPEAFDSIQRLLAVAPGVGAYARASYARELQGDLAGARRLFELALQSARNPADAAFAHYYLGELAWNTNDLPGAEAAFGRAVSLDPSFPPPAAGLARIAWARHDLPGAIARYQAVVDRYPVPQYVSELADLYTAAGQPEAAARQWAVLRVQERLLQANGVDTDLELSLIRADHGLELDQGLAAAQAEWGRRHSVLAADALAWQLHAHGRDGEALGYADEALHLGTRNPLLLFHRGMIEKGLGHNDAARRDLAAAVGLNPGFSILHAGTAAHALADLRVDR